MQKIDREWLKRISEYQEITVPLKIGKAKKGEGKEALAEEDGEADREETGEISHPDKIAGEGEVPSLSIPEDVKLARSQREEKAERQLHNLNLAPQAFDLKGRYLRVLASRFARMVSKVAEDSADLPSQGDEEWDMEELRQRRFTGRLVSQCRLTREKRKVAIVLDTSPSCQHQARLFGTIATVAEALGDCELYDAPNFSIYSRKIDQEWELLAGEEREWQFKQRVVLAFGDFDGIERISRASAQHGNKIYWFSCEERATILENNRERFIKEYKGFYFPATNLNSLMKAMGKVR